MKNSAVPCGVIILAAGLGKRMKSALPKVLHEISGQPLLFHILDRLLEATPQASIALVVGHAKEQVESAVKSVTRYREGLKISFIHQPNQLGTGHAARCAIDSAWGVEAVQSKLPILVLPGDSPLIPASLIAQMVEPLGRTAAMRLLTCTVPDPTGYGRIVRRGTQGPVLRIVEEKDANLRERAIREVAASIYCFQASFLKAALNRLSDKNAQGEFYLTDLVGQAARAKKPIDVLRWNSPEDLRGVNDPWELAHAAKMLNERTIKRLAQQGVRFMDPWSVQVEIGVSILQDAVVHRGVVLQGSTRVETGAVIGPNVVLKDVQVGARANVKAGSVGDSSTIGPGALVGPYAHLRPGSEIGANAKIGNFVELKKTRIGEASSVAHLSYLGDAEVGARVNIGCGFVTCNYDGRLINGSRKHKTIIEDDAFVGSDCQAVAPVKIGRGAFVASGSTITEDVEADALAIARSRQVNKPGYAIKLKPSAE